MSTAGRFSIRHTSPTVRPGTTLVINSFSPLTINSLPRSSARVRSAVRSDPAQGSVSANAESRSPLASRGRNRCFCSGLPNVRTGSTAPMQPCTLASPATVGSSVAIRARNGANARNGAPMPPYSLIDQETPIARCRQFAEHQAADLAALVKSEPDWRCRRTTASESSITRCTSARRLNGGGRKKLDGQMSFPDGAVDRAVDRLKPRGEEPFDLVVGLVDGAGAPRFFFALAAELKRRFGEGGFAVGRHNKPRSRGGIDGIEFGGSAHSSTPQLAGHRHN